MDNRSITQLTPRARAILSPRHRKISTRQFRQTEATITALIAASEYLGATDQITASHQLQALADKLLFRQDRILSRA